MYVGNGTFIPHEYRFTQSSQEKTFLYGETFETEAIDEPSFKQAIKSDNLVAPEIIMGIAGIIRDKTQFLELDTSTIPNYIDGYYIDGDDYSIKYSKQGTTIQEVTDWVLEQERPRETGLLPKDIAHRISDTNFNPFEQQPHRHQRTEEIEEI